MNLRKSGHRDSPATTRVVQRPHALLYVILFELWPLASGCVTLDRPRPPRTIGEAAEGMTVQQLEHHFGRATHEFSVKRDEESYICVSYAFGQPYVKFYFLLRNERLLKVIEPPKYEYKVVPYRKGSTRAIREPFDPERRVETVMAANGLSSTQLVTSAIERSRKSNDFSALPAFLITAPVWALMIPEAIADYERNSKLAARLDGFRVQIGDTEREVEQIFGKPRHVLRSDSGVVRIYGPGVAEAPLRMVDPWSRFSRVAVSFVDGKAHMVFSHGFFDGRFFGTP